MRTIKHYTEKLTSSLHMVEKLKYYADKTPMCDKTLNNPVIEEQRISHCTDMYYDSLDHARGVDRSVFAKNRGIELAFTVGFLTTYSTINQPDKIIAAIETDPRRDRIENDILEKPQTIREYLYSTAHKHITQNQDKAYAQSQKARKLLEFLRNQCPSIIRQKRIDQYCDQTRKDNLIWQFFN
jgi:hypothetical protein